jgi:hypothetical protein
MDEVKSEGNEMELNSAEVILLSNIIENIAKKLKKKC